ncbi:hypothetical protein J6590_096218 [Homalodisca vitripennis]|nr:hypothetical protein J6590_096218 [Homalodisca vitripennis]
MCVTLHTEPYTCDTSERYRLGPNYKTVVIASCFADKRQRRYLVFPHFRRKNRPIERDEPRPADLQLSQGRTRTTCVTPRGHRQRPSPCASINRPRHLTCDL